jgi:protein involved in ribonucleotide reduction
MYLIMTENDASKHIEGHTNVISYQDGETPHICKIVLQSLNTTFACKWVGVGRQISRHLRSPDLTQLDLVVNNNVAITVKIKGIGRYQYTCMSECKQQELNYGLDVCRNIDRTRIKIMHPNCKLICYL